MTNYDNQNSINVKVGLANMLRGGVIMDVINPEQASIAEESGAVAVIAIQKVPFDIRSSLEISRMASIETIEKIKNTVKIPVMANVRIGHFVEAQILEELGVDFIDESEILTPADKTSYIDKTLFKTPFICGCSNLREALKRIEEGASMIRTKGDAGTGNIAEAVKHQKKIKKEISLLKTLTEEEIKLRAKLYEVSEKFLNKIMKEEKLPVPNFAAGGVATPADASMMMQLGAEGVFVGSGIFKSSDPQLRAKAIVKAVKNYKNPEKLLEVSRGLAEEMPSYAAKSM